MKLRRKSINPWIEFQRSLGIIRRRVAEDAWSVQGKYGVIIKKEAGQIRSSFTLKVLIKIVMMKTIEYSRTLFHARS